MYIYVVKGLHDCVSEEVGQILLIRLLIVKDFLIKIIASALSI